MAAFTVHIGGHNYTIAGDDLTPNGKRAYVRRQKALQPADPGIPVTVSWQYHGPIGKSRAMQDPGHDHGTLETRWDNVLTSLGAVSTLTLSTRDPLSSGSAALGAMPLGARALGGGSSLATPQAITHIKEAGGQLFVGRGGLVTQVNPSSWAVVATTVMGAVVRGMAQWFMKLRIGLGGTKAIQTVTGVNSASAATFTNTQVSASDVFAKEMAVGNNSLWMVRADVSGTNENRLRRTTDDFASISTGFVVGDPGINATGLARIGGSMAVGSEIAVNGYTDEGFPFNLIEALRDARSANNARKMATGPDGWLYVCTDLTLYAVKGQTANPIGIGSDSLKGFEGFDGKPVALLPWRESLFVAYESSAGTTWRILRGQFNPNLTPGSGELDWYPFATRTAGAVREISATSSSTLPTIVWGEGASQLARIAQGRGAQDYLDTSYSYSTAGGQWFGSSWMVQPFIRKTVRWGRFIAEDMKSGDSWMLAVAFDGGSYTNIGSAVTSSGAAKVVPATPTSAPTGFIPKPRITQVASGATSGTTPPKLRGTLEVCFDLRPDMVTEVTCILAVSRAEKARLRAMTDGEQSTGRQPVEIRLPGETTTYYGYVNADDEQDLTGAEVTGAAVTLLLYDAS